MAKKGIKANTAGLGNKGEIRSNANLIRDLPVNFSFHYLVRDSHKFDYNDRDFKYFDALLERTQEVSKMTLKEFKTRPNKTLRNHDIAFGDANVSEDGFGIPHRADLDADAWQFSISVNAHGRVHGFFIDNTFYVVWLDPYHALYPGAK
jgi:hypothetical protein